MYLDKKVNPEKSKSHISVCNRIFFSYFSTNIFVVVTQKNEHTCLNLWERILLQF